MATRYTLSGLGGAWSQADWYNVDNATDNSIPLPGDSVLVGGDITAQTQLFVQFDLIGEPTDPLYELDLGSSGTDSLTHGDHVEIDLGSGAVMWVGYIHDNFTLALSSYTGGGVITLSEEAFLWTTGADAGITFELFSDPEAAYLVNYDAPSYAQRSNYLEFATAPSLVKQSDGSVQLFYHIVSTIDFYAAQTNVVDIATLVPGTVSDFSYQGNLLYFRIGSYIVRFDDLYIDPNISAHVRYTITSSDIQPDGHGGTQITLSAACFAAGTAIRTTQGDRLVEELRPGDRIRGAAGGEHTVAWAGGRRLDLRAHPEPELVAPIRIRRGAIGPGVPVRDLVVSPDHGIGIDGVVVAAHRLVNGLSIVQELDWPAIIYCHVELDQHALLLAEGQPAESYLPSADAGFFGRGGRPAGRHPGSAAALPGVPDDAAAHAIHRRIAARAGVSPQPPATTDDPDLRLRVGECTIRPILLAPGRALFALPPSPGPVQLLSRAARPTALRPWAEDRRRLGVAVRRIAIVDDEGGRDLALDHPALDAGWWAPEPASRWRWTSGAATLPCPPGTRQVTIRYAGMAAYPVDAAAAMSRNRRASSD